MLLIQTLYPFEMKSPIVRQLTITHSFLNKVFIVKHYQEHIVESSLISAIYTLYVDDLNCRC